MTPGKKYTLSTSVFYLILLPLILLEERLSPSGPCNPGMGFLLFMFALLASGIAFVVSVAKRMMGRRDQVWGIGRGSNVLFCEKLHGGINRLSINILIFACKNGDGSRLKTNELRKNI